jgi:branched-chain amino acid transport system substrate-binding protein
MRKSFKAGLIGTFAVAAFALVGAAHAEDTIKIGALLIDAGPLAGLKESQTKAINLAIEEVNAAGGANGKKLEADFITYPGTPDTAVDGATRAVQKDGALFLTGMDTSAVSPALSAKLASLNALMIEVFAQADGMTGKGCNANYFRANVNDSMIMNAVGQFLKDKPVKKWDVIAVDYSSGRDAAAKFQTLVKSQGGSIGKVLFAPSGTADFGAKISELGADPADGLYVTIFGSDAINLAKQQAQFGLFGKYKMVIGNSFIIPQVLPAMGETTVGVYQTLGFVPGEPGAQAQAFVKAYQAKYNGELPAYTSADQYAAIQLMAAAINKAKSTDVAAVRAALAGLKADTVLGEIHVRAEDHQTARPILMNQIVKSAEGKAAYEIKTVFPGDELLPPVDPACKM